MGDHTWKFIVGWGQDAAGKSLDTIEQCSRCGVVRHSYAHGGGQTSPNYPRFYDFGVLEHSEPLCAGDGNRRP